MDRVFQVECPLFVLTTSGKDEEEVRQEAQAIARDEYGQPDVAIKVTELNGEDR